MVVLPNLAHHGGESPADRQELPRERTRKSPRLSPAAEDLLSKDAAELGTLEFLKRKQMVEDFLGLTSFAQLSLT